MAKSKSSSSWEDEAAKDATADRAREKSAGGNQNNLSIKGRRFTFGGANLGRELKGIIVNFSHLRTYYQEKFEEGTFTPPTCFAISEDGEDMEPHDNSIEKQNKTCDGCPMNEWGSAERGRGKACADRRRLGIIHIDDAGSAEDIAEANVAMLTMPPTSVKNWQNYMEELEAKVGRAPYGVITKITFDADEDYPVLIFEVEEKIKDKEIYEAVKERRDEVMEDLMRPFQKVDDEDDDKPRKKKKGKKVEEDDEDDEDNGPKRGKASKSKKSRVKDEEDEDEDEDDEDEDEKPRKKKRAVEDDEDEDNPRRKRTKKGDDDADEDDEDDEDADDKDDEDDEDDEDDKPKRGTKRGKAVKDDDEDEDGDAPKKRKKSRFGK